MGGWTELVEAFDFMLRYVPRDESVENGADREVRAQLEALGLKVHTVEWLHEDECFEVKFNQYVDREDLNGLFSIGDIDRDVDSTLAWLKPKWEIVK